MEIEKSISFFIEIKKQRARPVWNINVPGKYGFNSSNKYIP